MPSHEGVLSSGALAVGADQLVTAAGKPALLYGYILLSGTAASSVTFKDATGGTVLWTDSIKSTTSAGDASVNNALPYPIIFTKNMSVTVAGTGAVAYVLYIPI